MAVNSKQAELDLIGATRYLPRLPRSPEWPRRRLVPKAKVARVDLFKARAERLEKRVGEMEQKLGKRTGDAKLRMFRKRMKRAQRRLTDFLPKKPKAGEGGEKTG